MTNTTAPRSNAEKNLFLSIGVFFLLLAPIIFVEMTYFHPLYRIWVAFLAANLVVWGSVMTLGLGVFARRALLKLTSSQRAASHATPELAGLAAE